jgi:hypothetical protein
MRKLILLTLFSLILISYTEKEKTQKLRHLKFEVFNF